jgi:hypothetical protein
LARSLPRIVVGFALLAVAGCDDSPTSRAERDAAGTGYPEDRLITDSIPADPEVDRDPTPQTGTGGVIPGGGDAGAAGRQQP